MTEFDWATAPTICELDGYRWVLGPQADKMNWYDATEWCKSVGGVLPPRGVLLLAYENEDIKGRFSKDSFYWSSAECGSGFAWQQDFDDGCQDLDGKYSTYLVRAVRAIKIGEE